MLFQPSNVSPDEVNGTGTIDATQDLAVSWRVSGDSPMTAYKIDILENTAASTLVYTTGETALLSPFYGTDYNGNTVYFTATITAATLSAAGIANGNEYKLVITQWWTANDSVQQLTASVFITRAAPTLTIAAIDDPVDTNAYTFSAVYTQAQGDPVRFMRWQIAEKDENDQYIVFKDTGNIYTGDLQTDYDGFLTGTDYGIRCNVETSNGQTADTGWVDFSVSYSLEETAGSVSACQAAGDCYVWLQWSDVESADGYAILRKREGESHLFKVAEVSATSNQAMDYSAKSGQTYTYYVFPTGNLAYLSQPMVSNQVSVQYWMWCIVEASPTGNPNEYGAIASYIFRYGAGGVTEGGWSNNSSPAVQTNFSRYPTWQGSSANYRSGSVSGYIGTILQDRSVYQDTVAESEAIFSLSTTPNALFLIDPKGRFLQIRVSSPISMSIDHKKKSMPQTMTVPWVEVGNAENCHVLMSNGGDVYPRDRVILTTLTINPATGALLWTTPDDYTGTGSKLYVQAGQLMQNDEGPFAPATMAFDPTTGIVTATPSS